MPSLGSVIARNIAAERARRSWTQQQLAERMGWTHTQVSRSETGGRVISADDLLPLCAALGVTLADLARGMDAQALAILGIRQ
jgi:transcriptional regulator with XRE-family HTH domain